jgi:hypothetical protein
MAGVAASITNTTMLIVAAQVILLPIWLTKGVDSFANVVLNFLPLHLVVLRHALNHAGAIR